VPLAVLRDTVQPYPTFSELIALALDELRAAIRERGRTRPANGVAAVRCPSIASPRRSAVAAAGRP
jgi:hypothetical protein